MTGRLHDEQKVAQQRAVGPLAAVVGGVIRRVALVPSGPLGWLSTRTLFPLLGGPVFRAMGQALQLQVDDELLDVGCGSGAFLAGHARQVRRVAGIDLSEMQIGLAQRNLGERIAAGTAEIVTGDAGALPWPDGSFTVVTSMESFEAFPDPELVLAEIFRVLRPGGRAVLNIGVRVPAGTRTQWQWGMSWVWAEDDVRRMVEQAGFTSVSVRYARVSGDDLTSRLIHRLFGAGSRTLRIVSATRT